MEVGCRRCIWVKVYRWKQRSYNIYLKVKVRPVVGMSRLSMLKHSQRRSIVNKICWPLTVINRGSHIQLYVVFDEITV